MIFIDDYFYKLPNRSVLECITLGKSRKSEIFIISCYIPTLISIAMILALQNYRLLIGGILFFFLPTLFSIGFRFDTRYPKNIATQIPFRASFSWYILHLFIDIYWCLRRRTTQIKNIERNSTFHSGFRSSSISQWYQFDENYNHSRMNVLFFFSPSPALYKASHCCTMPKTRLKITKIIFRASFSWSSFISIYRDSQIDQK